MWLIIKGESWNTNGKIKFLSEFYAGGLAGARLGLSFANYGKVWKANPSNALSYLEFLVKISLQ